MEVVGIVADTKYTSIRAATPPTMFDYYARRSMQTLIGMTFMVRVDGNAAALERPIREAVARASKGVAATGYRTQADQIDRTIGPERVFARLLTVFGGFALALAWFTGRLLDSLLFGLTPTDPATLIAAAATLLAVVTIAGAVPARRARADPGSVC